MKILVTGGAGFIGSHLTDRLLAENNQVVALDNLSLGRKSNLKQASENPNFTFIEEDILHDKGKVTAAIAKAFAESEFEKFRVLQDRTYQSDFDRLVASTEQKN